VKSLAVKIGYASTPLLPSPPAPVRQGGGPNAIRQPRQKKQTGYHSHLGSGEVTSPWSHSERPRWRQSFVRLSQFPAPVVATNPTNSSELIHLSLSLPIRANRGRDQRFRNFPTHVSASKKPSKRTQENPNTSMPDRSPVCRDSRSPCYPYSGLLVWLGVRAGQSAAKFHPRPRP